jgi:homoserine O-succinyltransferase
MPVFLATDPGAAQRSSSLHVSAQARAASGHGLTIGLVNNMPDEALKATERQYLALLNAASGSLPIHLSFYTLPGISRSPSLSRHIRGLYANVDDLLDGRLDGLIVTGKEPVAVSLREEACWLSFTRLLEWAQENTHSSVWSCLAAHAAALHLDGIERVRRDDKLFGVIACDRVSDHPLTAHLSSPCKLPHSRWNGLPADPLTACGYTVLTQTAGGEVDAFLKQQKSLFLFFQGHPEYEADTLLREYRRDLGRYCRGEIGKYPGMPQGYFDRSTVEALNALQLRAISGQAEALLPEISAALSNTSIENTWQASAVSIYSDWLRYLRAQKEMALRSQSMIPARTVPKSLVTTV